MDFPTKNQLFDAYTGNLEWLREKTFYLVPHGSFAYGTNVEGSDIDLKGLCVAPRHYSTGFLNKFEQALECFGDYDCIIYDVRKFIHLVLDNNPSVMEILWAEPETWIYNNGWPQPIGFATAPGKIGYPTTPFEKLYAARWEFLSREAKARYSGYAVSQVHKIDLHRQYLLNPPKKKPEREDFGLPGHPKIPKEQRESLEALMQKQVEAWRLDFGAVSESYRVEILNNLAINLADMKLSVEDQYYAASAKLGLDLEAMEYLKKERAHKNAVNEWAKYQEWKKNRNQLRAGMEAKIGYDCYSDDTEFLTKEGWKKFDEIAEQDQLATIFVDNTSRPMEHRVEKLGIDYQPYTYKLSKLYTGKMLNFFGTHLDCLVTPTHRMLYQTVYRTGHKLTPDKGWGSGPWQLNEAHLVPDTFNFLVAPTPKKRDWTHPAELQDLSIPPKAFMTLMGWYLSDGSAGKHKDKVDSIRISQRPAGKLGANMKKFHTIHGKRIETGLYQYTRRPDGVVNFEEKEERVLTVSDPTIVERIVGGCGIAKSKRIPRWVFGLGSSMQKALLKGLLGGDGTKRPQAGSFIYYSSLKGLADDVQELALMCGYQTSLYGPYHHPTVLGETKMYQVWIGMGALYPQTKQLVRSANIREVDVENQRVVCFTVPNGTLVTRRKGFVHFQGNCKHAMHCIRLSRTALEIIQGKGVIVKRPDAEELVAIRKGAYTYDQFRQMVKDLDDQCRIAMETCTLPNQGNRKLADRICQEIVENVW